MEKDWEDTGKTKVSLYWIKVMPKRQKTVWMAKNAKAGLMAHIM